MRPEKYEVDHRWSSCDSTCPIQVPPLTFGGQLVIIVYLISHHILWFLMSKRDDLWNFFDFIKTNLRTNNIWLWNSFKTFKLLCLPQLHAKITCFNQFLITDSLSLHRKCIINDMLLFYETRDTKIWPPQKWMKGPKFNRLIYHLILVYT